MMTTNKTLFKFWVEKAQLQRLKSMAKKEKVSVSWLMRKAFDEFLQRTEKK